MPVSIWLRWQIKPPCNVLNFGPLNGKAFQHQSSQKMSSSGRGMWSYLWLFWGGGLVGVAFGSCCQTCRPCPCELLTWFFQIWFPRPSSCIWHHSQKAYLLSASAGRLFYKILAVLAIELRPWSLLSARERYFCNEDLGLCRHWYGLSFDYFSKVLQDVLPCFLSFI